MIEMYKNSETSQIYTDGKSLSQKGPIIKKENDLKHLEDHLKTMM